ncbi:hypothetical protein HN014_18210 [Aquimarina sp. TRL1]|uniref:hypothetical protein n=1 Tax=Aquimarina sp. (strain TRL1) TaxID=2736252 RepID=UPI00158EE3B1|nr:hypothetical protein [Aquimarina sp. TRL1]QKX06767.1 hypothetical protein HN014_18210 [Aquimarina sp. TRL1]
MKHIFTKCILISIGMSFFSCNQTTSKEERMGCIQGLITDMIYETPIHDATITISSKDMELADIVQYPDDQGNFIWKGLPVGTFDILIMATSYYPKEVSVTITSVYEEQYAHVQLIRLPPGVTTDD